MIWRTSSDGSVVNVVESERRFFFGNGIHIVWSNCCAAKWWQRGRQHFGENGNQKQCYYLYYDIH